MSQPTLMQMIMEVIHISTMKTELLMYAYVRVDLREIYNPPPTYT